MGAGEIQQLALLASLGSIELIKKILIVQKFDTVLDPARVLWSCSDLEMLARAAEGSTRTRERGKSNALNEEILPKNLLVGFGLRMQASDKNNELKGGGWSIGLLARGHACPLEQRQGKGSPAEGWSKEGLCLMYELWLAIVSHPRTSSRQNKNLLWLIRKTGQLWIDCTQPVYGHINSNEAGWVCWTRCVYVRAQEKGSGWGGVSLNNVISALWLFVPSSLRIRLGTLKPSFSCLI